MKDILEMEGTVQGHMLNCIANFIWFYDLYMYNYSLFNLCNDLKEISKIEFLMHSSFISLKNLCSVLEKFAKIFKNMK